MFERGAAGTSLEDVHAAAEVSPSQIYHYFKDKRSLVKAVIAVQVTQVIGAFGSVSLPVQPPGQHGGAARVAGLRCES
jgi:AcrR family transcriptional regulator